MMRNKRRSYKRQRCELTVRKSWDSVGLQERFKRADLLKMVSLVVDGIRDNTLNVKTDDAEEDDIDNALDMIARAIKAEVCETEYDKDIYKREISKFVAAESVSGTPQLLLHKFSPSLNANSLTSLLIGNMVTSVLDHHTTS